MQRSWCCKSLGAKKSSHFATMAHEHQEYIQAKVNPTLEALVTQVLLERPEQPVPYMIKWLAEQTKAEVPEIGGEGEMAKLREENEALQNEIRELEAKLAAGASGIADRAEPAAAEAKEAEEEEEEEEESDDDDAPDMPDPPPNFNRGQRTSVSAEAYGAWNKFQEFKPPVHAKSEDQKTRISNVLQQCFLFSLLDTKSVEIIIDAMVEKSFVSGDKVITQGDDGDVMFVIEKGVFDCLKMIDGADKVVKTCRQGEFFGELALLYNCPRAASVAATEDSVAWQLDRETFNAIVRDSAMKRRETNEAFLKLVPLLEKMDSYERGALADSLKQETFAAGTVVIQQGQEGDRFYLIDSGECVAKREGGDAKELCYKRGDYFGELALLRNDVRAATVTASTEVQLLWIDRKGFKTLLGPVEELMESRAKDYS